jgi:hypothetical protein
MQDSSHLTIILCSSVIIIVISHKQKVNRKNNNNIIIAVPPGGGGLRLLFMFSRKIIDNTLVVEIQKGILLYSCHIVTLTLTQNIIHNKVKMRRRDAGNYVDKHCTIT